MKVFMISYGGGHSNIIAAVYKELIKNPDNDIIYVALTGAPLKLKGSGINYITISEIAKMLTYYDEIVELGRKYGMPFHNDSFGILEEDTICYYGIGMHDLINEYGEVEAIKRFNSCNRKAFLPVETMRCLLENIKPDACVITSSPRMEKATGLAADQLGIPIVRINDLPICDFIPYKCSLCVMNEWAKNNAVSVAGVPEAKIFVTGQPTFEADFDVDKTYVEKVKNESGAIRFSRVVTFFLENGVDQSKEVQGIIDIAKKERNIFFILKLHPNQPLYRYGNIELENVFVTNGDAKPFFLFSDLVITTFSTTGMESALFGIPVIVINYDYRVYSPDYIKMGIAVLCDKPESLGEMINLYLDKKSKEYAALKASQENFQLVRNAANNICDVIESSVAMATSL